MATEQKETANLVLAPSLERVAMSRPNYFRPSALDAVGPPSPSKGNPAAFCVFSRSAERASSPVSDVPDAGLHSAPAMSCDSISSAPRYRATLKV